MERGQFLLVEMGLLSFIAVSQCAPAILLGLYWRRGNRQGAFAGISAGFFMWFYTLIIPALEREGVLAATFLVDGPLGLGLLRPTAFLGLEGLDTTQPRRVLVALPQCRALRPGLAADRAGRGRPGPGRRLRGRARGGQGRRRARPPSCPRPRSSGSSTTTSARRRREAIVRELFGGKAPADLSVPELLELRIRFERLLAASLGAAAARIIVEDQFTISKDEAQQLVTSFQQHAAVAAGHRGGGAARRAAARLRGRRAWTTASSPPTSTGGSSP